MSYKTILSYLPDQERAERLLDHALPVTQENDAHLIGLHVLPRIPLMYGAVAAEIPYSVIQQQEDVLQGEADALKDYFYGRCEKAGVKAEWRCNKLQHTEVTSDIVGQALCADLIVVAQSHEDMYGKLDDMPSRVTTEAGRPTLIIPHVGSYKSIGKHVVVAWNGSREAARAAFDAMPFLKTAQSVRILAIDPVCREGYDSIALGDEIAVVLARHNVKAEVTVTHRGDVSIGDELLNRLADEGCDLLVMGCYGHSRLRETLFGGVTQSLLEHMTAPVLMAH